MNVVIYTIPGHRARNVCEAMLAGIRRHGVSVEVKPATEFKEPEADVSIHYGLAYGLDDVQRAYKRAGLKDVYIDLGYWGRREGGRYVGYHRMSVNDWHATDYFQSRAHSFDRASRFGLEFRAYRSDGYVLLAGMGPKAARMWGIPSHDWEVRAIKKIRKATERPIVYRPKPSWVGAPNLRGCEYSPRNIPIEEALQGACAIVTHHSNTAVDGVVHGVPSFGLEAGVGTAISQPISEIERPRYPDDETRRQFCADVAHLQYSVPEMLAGAAWDYLVQEGLVVS